MSWSRARNILCMRLGSVGSVLMVTPALRALKEAAPERCITLLASPAGAAVAGHVAEIDHVVTYDAPWACGANMHHAQADRRLMSRLDSADYDACVIFTSPGESALPAALLCMMADIPLRLAHSVENPWLLLTDWLVDGRDTRAGDDVCHGAGCDPRVAAPRNGIQRHEVQRHLDLVAAVGAHTLDQRLSFSVFDADHGALRPKLGSRGVDMRRPRLILHPGAQAGSRDDAFEHYLATMRGIRSQLDCQMLLTGGEHAVPLCRALEESVGEGAISLAGDLSLGEFGALIASSTVLLSNGSASVHIAAAVGTPVIDLQAREQSQQTSWQVPGRVSGASKQSSVSGVHDEIDSDLLVSAVCDLWNQHAGLQR